MVDWNDRVATFTGKEHNMVRKAGAPGPKYWRRASKTRITSDGRKKCKQGQISLCAAVVNNDIPIKKLKKMTQIIMIFNME